MQKLLWKQCRDRPPVFYILNIITNNKQWDLWEIRGYKDEENFAYDLFISIFTWNLQEIS